MKRSARVFAPGSIGNVGPGFDVLGLSVPGIGDIVSVEITEDANDEVIVRGRDAEAVPTDPVRNIASIAARAILRAHGQAAFGLRIEIDKGLPLSGGLGGSAASAVAGAVAAALAIGVGADSGTILEAAFEGESAIGGHHLDNIAPSLYGGLTLILSTEQRTIVQIESRRLWWLTLVTPQVRIETRSAREVLPRAITRELLVHQTASVAALVHAFSQGDANLVRLALDDRFAEPARASLIPSFSEAKAAALSAGAIGCSISGSGPTLFAIAEDEGTAQRVAASMLEAFAGVGADTHITQMSNEGAHAL